MGNTFGPFKVPILTSAESASIAVATSDNLTAVYTKAFPLAHLSALALDYKFASDGVVNVKIELEQGNSLPTTEGSADSAWVVAEGISEVATVVDETQHFKPLSPVVTKYARLKLTGLTGNAATTVLTAYQVRTEES